MRDTLKTAAISLLIALSTVCVMPAQASRYAVANPDVLSREQESPLFVTVDLTFPRQHVRTVGEAVNYALMRSGYRLAESALPEQAALLDLPLPEVHRSFTAQRLTAVLVALGKPAYRLVVDDVNRLVAYELAPEFKGRDVAHGDAK